MKTNHQLAAILGLAFVIILAAACSSEEVITQIPEDTPASTQTPTQTSIPPSTPSATASPLPYPPPGIEPPFTATPEIPYPILRLSFTPTATPRPTRTFTPTPTPTEITPTPTLSPELGSLEIVFLRQDEVWVWTPAGERSLNQQAELNPSSRRMISDDGAVFVFTNKGGIWAIDTHTGEKRLIIGTAEFAELEPRDPGVALGQLGWIPNSHQLLFNTNLILELGSCGTDDLYLVEVDSGRRRQLRPPGQGGRFYPSPDGNLIGLVTPEKISLYDLQAGSSKLLLKYELVLTYSEFSFYPELHWAPDSSALMVVIPPADSQAHPDDPNQLWLIPVNGSAPVVVNEFSTRFRSTDVFLSPDLQWMAYAPKNTRQVEFRISRTDGSEDHRVHTGRVYEFDWVPDSQHYTLWDGEQFYYGEVLGEQSPILAEYEYVGGPQWLDGHHFLFVTGESGNWELWVGTPDGRPRLLIGSEPGFTNYISVLGNP